MTPRMSALLGLGCLVACNARDASVARATSTHDARADAEATGSPAGSSADAGRPASGSADGGTTPASLGVGVITLTGRGFVGLGTQSAFFSLDASAAPGFEDCQVEEVGACRLQECPAARPPERPHAGGIAFVAYDAAGRETAHGSIAPDSIGNYTPRDFEAGTLRGGERVTFRATGGDVPAFQDSVEVPASLRLSNPPVDGASGGEIPIDVDRYAPPPLVWDDGGQSDVALLVRGSVEAVGGARQIMACVFASSELEAHLPVELLSRYRAQALYLYTSRSTPLGVGAWDVWLRTVTDVTTGDGLAAVELRLSPRMM